MPDDLHFIIGFFVPIGLAGGAGYILGRVHERLHWNHRLKKKRVPTDEAD